MPEEQISDEQLAAAVERLSDPERFARPNSWSPGSPQDCPLYLVTALDAADSLVESHLRDPGRLPVPDEDQRLTAIRALLTESQMGTDGRVAVGWALRQELENGDTRCAGNQERGELKHGNPLSRTFVLRTERRWTRPLIVDPLPGPNNWIADVTADDVSVTHLAPTHGSRRPRPMRSRWRTKNNAKCVAMVEVANWLEIQPSRTSPTPTSAEPSATTMTAPPRSSWSRPGTPTPPLGRTSVPSARAPALIGTPSGLITIEMGGLTIYDAGGTCLFR